MFGGAAAALVLTSAIGVAFGAALSEFISPKLMTILAGSGFLVIGAWTLAQGLRA
ncbi:hypothetical protein D3C83_324940 [compost metagenome]